LISEVIAAIETDRNAVERLRPKIYSVIDPITFNLDQLTQIQLDVAAIERQKARKIYRQTWWVFVPLLGTAIGFGSPVGFIIVRQGLIHGLRQAINSISQATNEIASVAAEQERIVAQQAAAVQQTATSTAELNSSARNTVEQANVTKGLAESALNLTQQGN